jgi:hypothetical protein
MSNVGVRHIFQGECGTVSFISFFFPTCNCSHLVDSSTINYIFSPKYIKLFRPYSFLFGLVLQERVIRGRSRGGRTRYVATSLL